MSDQVVRLAGLRVAFATRTVLDPPRQITTVSTTDFPFRSFDQRWSFTPAGEFGTLVQYDLTFELRFGFLHGLMDMVADQRQIAETTVNAFGRRARQVYGSHGKRRSFVHDLSVRRRLGQRTRSPAAPDFFSLSNCSNAVKASHAYIAAGPPPIITATPRVSSTSARVAPAASAS